MKTLVVLCTTAALGADPAPAAKKAFLEHKTIYVSFEITETGTREFGAPKDAKTDKAFRINKSVKFELPLEKHLPGLNPPSSMPLSPAEMMDKSRFSGWSVAPADTEAAMRQLTTGKIDLTNTSMFLPVEFSIDDVQQFHYRDTPDSGWATETTTSKGRGVAYVHKGGMLLCDLKKMTCDLNNVGFNFQDGVDKVTVASTSDVPGFEARRETVVPSRSLPKIPADVAKRLIAFTIALPEPSTVTFSGPSGDPSSVLATTVTIKVTLAARSGRAQAPRPDDKSN
jgi:hypothetical protein